MSRPTPTMEMFAVGAYLRFIEGCELVTYHTELPDPKQFWVEVLGRSEANQSITYVDLPEKFDWYPAQMRRDTLIRKMVARYVELAKIARVFEYEPERSHFQLWLPRGAASRVLEAIPTVRDRLAERHDVKLEVIERDEVARRIEQVVQRALRESFDYDNLFVRALMLTHGRLDYERGEPMDEAHIEAMYKFQYTIARAADVPAFVYEFLTSREIVDWLGFYSASLDDMAAWLTEVGPSAELGELQQAFGVLGEVVDEGGYDYDEDEYGEPVYHTRRYTPRDLAELTRLVFANAEVVRAESIGNSMYSDFLIEVDFMVPFLSRAQEWLDSSQIEREILRYGGSRDLMQAHFSNQHPEKGPYRAILRIEFYDPKSGGPKEGKGGKVMNVPIAGPQLTESINVAVSIHYPTDLTGYFVLMMNRAAGRMRL